MNVKDLLLPKWISSVMFLDVIRELHGMLLLPAAHAGPKKKKKEIRFALVIRSFKPNVSDWHFDKSSPHVKCTYGQSNTVSIEKKKDFMSRKCN